ncbi:MAG: nitroreductase family protein [ANME-2 cluster archaeon]|nr:nitroreductase family protein [ANME-2 cluster archaeon]MBC2700167.1 nitroreductase family protein [ANME-2 cluster archaeon]MBC2706701.1 nitroreductase family protein [ANME-2 cluster archaeon]MBC2745625.1 nitroreductase family protein [ANME-2 cluster archaeon]
MVEKTRILELIRSRRSIREFLVDHVEDSMVEDILEAGRWAPSGLNNQPWRFVVVKDREIAGSLAGCTRYSTIVHSAHLLIAVFLDRDVMYDHTKDIQACGAAIQNMLLVAHGMGLGAVWLGEILNQKNEVGDILNAPESLELMAVIAIGYPAADSSRSSGRWEISEITSKERFGNPWK